MTIVIFIKIGFNNHKPNYHKNNINHSLTPKNNTKNNASNYHQQLSITFITRQLVNYSKEPIKYCCLFFRTFPSYKAVDSDI